MKNLLSTLTILCGLYTTQLVAYDPPATQMHVDDIEIKESEQYAFAGIGAKYSDSFEEKGVVDFRLGIQNSVWRTIFSYESNFEEYQAIMLEVDRTVVAGLLGGKGRIYLGVSAGWVLFSGDRIENDLVVEWEDYGYAYGGNVGFMYYLSDRLDLSIGYRYLIVKDTCGASCIKDNIHGVEIALHYFF